MKNKKKTEEEILHAIRSGKTGSKVFEHLYTSCFPKVRALVFKGSGEEEEAKDIFQDGVLTFYKQVKLNKYKHYTEIDAYIYTICKNLWYKRVSQKNRQSQIGDQEENLHSDLSNPETDFFQEEKQTWVLNILNQIGERCKELMIHKVYYNLSIPEIREKMGFTTDNATKTKVYKCKQRLVNLLKDNEQIKNNFYYAD